jgi:hypothetical protein
MFALAAELMSKAHGERDRRARILWQRGVGDMLSRSDVGLLVHAPKPRSGGQLGQNHQRVGGDPWTSKSASISMSTADAMQVD